MMKNIIAAILVAALFTGCDTSNSNNTPVVPPVTQTGPVNPFPADGSLEVENFLTLSWTYDQADTFRVLLDTSNPPQRIEKDSLYANSLTTFVAGTGVVYYWQVIAVLSDGTEVPGDIWSFATKTATVNETSYEIIKHKIERITPNKIKLLFQVLDGNGNGVTNLVQGDFKFFEDGEEISPFESDLEIAKSPIEPVLNTLQMLDNSSSITGDDPQNLPTIKNIASEIVNNMISTQKISIYKFSSTTELVLDYTGISAQSSIINAINSIPLGASSTDLYGAIIEGSSELTESYDEEIVQSFMILISDGEDTQGSNNLASALDAATGKFIYTIGVGSEIDVEVLYLVGNAGFYRIDQSAQIDSVVTAIQTDIMQLSNSFYQLEYASPKRGNVEHFVELFINGNSINSTLNATYTSAGFFDPVPGIYFNAKFSEPEGVDEVELSTSGLPVDVTVQTFGIEISNDPSYSWSTDNNLIYNSLTSNNSVVEVSASGSASSGQTISIIVNDTVNGFSKTINFVIL